MKIDVTRNARTLTRMGAKSAPYVPEVDALPERAPDPRAPSRHSLAMRVPAFLRDDFARWGVAVGLDGET